MYSASDKSSNEIPYNCDLSKIPVKDGIDLNTDVCELLTPGVRPAGMHVWMCRTGICMTGTLVAGCSINGELSICLHFMYATITCSAARSLFQQGN
jgi:hypothetical protein